MVYAQSVAQSFSNSLFSNIVDPAIALLAFFSLLLFIITAIHHMYSADSVQKWGALFTRFGMIFLGLFVIFSVYTIFSFVGRFADSDRQFEQEEVQF